MAAEGATYTSPKAIPYKFSMAANVRGHSKVMAVTSQIDKLTVEEKNDKSTSVSLVSVYSQFLYHHPNHSDSAT